jgi:hypothetical protein
VRRRAAGDGSAIVGGATARSGRTHGGRFAADVGAGAAQAGQIAHRPGEIVASTI